MDVTAGSTCTSLHAMFVTCDKFRICFLETSGLLLPNGGSTHSWWFLGCETHGYGGSNVAANVFVTCACHAPGVYNLWQVTNSPWFYRSLWHRDRPAQFSPYYRVWRLSFTEYANSRFVIVFQQLSVSSGDRVTNVLIESILSFFIDNTANLLVKAGRTNLEQRWRSSWILMKTQALPINGNSDLNPYTHPLTAHTPSHMPRVEPVDVFISLAVFWKF